MTETNQAETPAAQPAEPATVMDSALRTRGNVQDITKILAGEGNAQHAEIRKRQEEGDPALQDVDLGAETPEAEQTRPDSAPESSEQGQDAQEATPGDDKPATPTSFKELADAAGIDLKDLYELTIGFGDGSGQEEPVKLGAIKDAFAKGLDIDSRTKTLETDKRSFENAQIVANEAIELQLNAMQLTPQQIEARADHVRQNKQREQQKLFEVLPELATDQELRTQTHKGIVDLLGPYGISEVAVNSLANHKYYKFLIDAVSAFEVIDKADANAKRLRKVGNGAGITRKTNGRGERVTESAALVSKAKQSGMQGDQVAAISALLGN